MVKDFLSAQKDLLAQAEERLEIYRDKLDKVNTIKDDIKSHIQSLPDPKLKKTFLRKASCQPLVGEGTKLLFGKFPILNPE